jgi:hypothetical protein
MYVPGTGSVCPRLIGAFWTYGGRAAASRTATGARSAPLTLVRVRVLGALSGGKNTVRERRDVRSASRQAQTSVAGRTAEARRAARAVREAAE